MSDDSASARIEVQLDRGDVMALLKHGKCASIKSVGPIQVKITTEQKYRPTIVVDSHDEEPEEVFG